MIRINQLTKRFRRMIAAGRAVRFYLFHTSPQRLLLTTFSIAILSGTILLALPWSHKAGCVTLLDALFTATSAVCVTGLIVVDTGADYTIFGQCVILFLIQVGGLGIMTFAAIAFEIGGSRMPLAHRAALEDSLFQRGTATDFSYVFSRILKLVFAIESIGAIVLYFGMASDVSAAHAAWSATFHAISAFCNAGFSIYPDSLIGFRHNSIVIVTIMVLIVFGGLGHVVLFEIYRDIRQIMQRRTVRTPHRYSLHTRVVLAMTIAMIVGGAILLFFFGCGTEHENQRSMAMFSGALFQSVTARTAGFNTVNTAHLPLASLIVLVILMGIGGSPGSCAGGIKTTTFAIWLARIRAALHGREDVILMHRRIPRELVLRAVALIGLTILWNSVGIILLSCLQSRCTPLKDILFEQISAFGTVGLSTGLTTKLTATSRWWIIITMFVGRLGPLTMVFSFLTTKRPRIGCPEGRLMIG